MGDGGSGAGRFLALIRSGAPVVADGAMGTSLMAGGLAVGAAPEALLLSEDGRAAIAGVHRGFLAAGSQVLLTCSFGANRWRLRRAGLEGRVGELAAVAAEVAISASEVAQAATEVARARAGDRAFVAGSIGPSGQLLAPLGTLSVEDAEAGFAESAMGLAAGGADVLWVETMSDLGEATAAVRGAQLGAPGLPVVATMAFGSRGRTTFGVGAGEAARALADLGAVAIGVNCGGSLDEAETALLAMAGAGTGLALVFKPNAGLPVLVEGRATYPATPEAMAESAGRARRLGATILGACCGGTAGHIRAIAAATRSS